MNTWAKHELRFLDLGDRRLNQRAVHLVEALAARPEASVPQATSTWAAPKAAYRFWDNPRLDPDAVAAAHRASTLARLPAAGPLLALQDTTDLDYSAHPATRDVGYLGRATQQGLRLHSVLLTSAAGVPLGLLHQHVWARDPAELGKRKARDRKETAAKESQRWLDAQTATHQALPAGRTVITGADREAEPAPDLCELAAEEVAESPRQPLQALVRDLIVKEHDVNHHVPALFLVVDPEHRRATAEDGMPVLCSEDLLHLLAGHAFLDLLEVRLCYPAAWL